MRDRAADLNVHSRKYGQLLPDFLGQLLPGFPAEFKRTLELRAVHAEGVLVQFGAACLAAFGSDLNRMYDYGLDLRDAEEKFLGCTSHPVGLLQGYSRNGADGDCERAFVERREETSSKGEEHHDGRRKQRSDSAE